MSDTVKTILLLICLGGLCGSDLRAADQPLGLAARYPGDHGLAADPAVFFAEDFESGDLSRWDHRRGPVVLTEAGPNDGRWCAELKMTRGHDTGGDIKKWFTPGADTVYVRFYVRFSADYRYVHHFVRLSATQAGNPWSGTGKAGLKPDGSFFSTAMEPWFAWGKNAYPGELSFYSYHMDLQPDPKMNKYWGAHFFPPGPDRGKAAADGKVVPLLGRWQCWEFMMQANTAPDKADGKQAMWVDGRLLGEFSGVRWRVDMDLKINCIWLQHYGYHDSDPTKQYWGEAQTVWFDDLVVARSYIGPKQEKKP